MLMPRGSNVSIEVASIDRTMMRALVLRDIKIKIQEDVFATISTIRVSENIWDTVKFLLGKDTFNGDVLVSDITVNVNDDTISGILLLSSLFSTDSNVGNSDNGLSFDGLKVSISNLGINLKYKGFNSSLKNLNGELELKENLKLSSFYINLPSVIVNTPYTQGFPVYGTDIRFSVNENFEVEASLQNGGLATKAAFDTIYIQGSLENINNIALAVSSGAVDGSIINLFINENQFSSLDFKKGLVKFEGMELSINLFEEGNFDFIVFFEQLLGTYEDYSVNFEKLYGDITYSLKEENAMGRVEIGSTLINGLENYNLKKLDLKETALDFSLGQGILGGQIRAAVNGYSNNEYIGPFDFSLQGNINLLLSDLRNSKGEIVLSKLNLPLFLETSELTLNYEGNGKTSGSLVIGNTINTSFNGNFENLSFEGRVYLSNFVPAKYTMVFNKY
ncbi:MAG: hypothetical protein HUK24_02035, partial [Sphaerochaetaceae bacterium]|nr:hypothetical protein [Sphaerochaetaceae bacterium]